MIQKSHESKKIARKLLNKYRVSKFSWTFKQIFFSLLWGYIAYYGYSMLAQWNFEMNYYAYFVLIVGLVTLRYGLKGVFSMVIWFFRKDRLVSKGVLIEARIVNVEYIDSWSTYQKWSFIFAVPTGKLLQGLNVLFKSERIFCKIPKSMIKTGDTVMVFIDPKNLNSYWMNVESIFKKYL